jgi:hypothetical protein
VNYLTKCVGRKSTKTKKSAKVINQERKRDSSSSVAIKNFLESSNSRSVTVVFKTGYRQKRVTDPSKDVTDPSKDVTDPSRDVTDPNRDVTDPNTEIYRLQDSILSV